MITTKNKKYFYIYLFCSCYPHHLYKNKYSTKSFTEKSSNQFMDNPLEFILINGNTS